MLHRHRRKKNLTCLKCQRIIRTDAGHRICPRCQKSHTRDLRDADHGTPTAITHPPGQPRKGIDPDPSDS